MKKSFEKELPQGYREAKVVDAKDIKFGIIMNTVALIIVALITVLTFFIVKPGNYFENFSLMRNTVFLAAMLLYIVLHELTHGLAYKALTGQKLKFGLTLTVAFCGVPDIFVYRKTALIALLAPFAVFTVVFGAMLIFFDDPWNKVYSAVLLGMHIGGCSGDLYDSFLYLFKFRSPDVLMRDTGPKQTFYVK